MDVEKRFTRITSLLGEPARATMLWNLLDGNALTATELAICADISPQSASSHLTKLVEAEFLRVEKQGRHRYYRFARPEVAYVIESIATLMPIQPVRFNRSASSQPGLEYARTCYDHLAGKVAILITQALLHKRVLEVDEKNFRVTQQGEHWFDSIGINVSDLRQNNRRSFARQCLDWSERKPHLAGALGAALLKRMVELGWIRRVNHSRMVVISAKGEAALDEKLALLI